MVKKKKSIRVSGIIVKRTKTGFTVPKKKGFVFIGGVTQKKFKKPKAFGLFVPRTSKEGKAIIKARR